MVVQSRRSRKADALRDLPLTYFAQFIGAAANERVLAALAKHGHGALRPSHGYIVQHLLAGPCSIGELARRLEITQQGVSKTVGEMLRAGYVERVHEPGSDERVRAIGLTRRGWASVDQSRAARAAVEADIIAVLGKRAFAQTRRALQTVLEALGAAEAVRGRRVKET